MTGTATEGRGWARTGATAGAVISVAGNVLHTLIPPDPRPADWHPQLGAVIGAVWWPVSLFLALEVLVSARWGDRWWWLLVRLGTVAPVAVVAAVVSYHHLAALLAYYREDSFTVHFGPVAVDGLMVLCSAALYRIRTLTPETADDRAALPAVGPDSAGPVVPPDRAGGHHVDALPGGRRVHPGRAASASCSGRDAAGPVVDGGRVDTPADVHPSAPRTSTRRRPVHRTAGWTTRRRPLPRSVHPSTQRKVDTPQDVHPPEVDAGQDRTRRTSTSPKQRRGGQDKTSRRPAKAEQARDIMAELGVTRSRAYVLADDPAALARVRAARASLNGHTPVGTP